VPAPDRSKFHSELLRWYEENKREMPWRRTRDPYRIWISEILLQQTRVDTVRARYESFLERFPTVRHLAEARIAEVLLAWQGLGYYGRARNLHRAARLITQQYSGEIPQDPVTLQRLPGIGLYTARAIASIAFGKDVAVLDGNVMRVLCRVFRLQGDPRTTAARSRLQALADELLPKGKASTFNQAMMELGALVCRPARPLCSDCPLSPVCQAFRKKQVHAFPKKTPRKPSPTRLRVVAAVFHRSRILFVHRPPEGLLGGLWELPGLYVNGGDTQDGFEKLKEMLRKVATLEAVSTREPFSVDHVYTHFREHLQVISCRGRPVASSCAMRQAEPFFQWIHPTQLSHFALTGASRKILGQVLS